MGAHKEDADVVAAGCDALGQVGQENMENKIKITESGGIELMNMALDRFPVDSPVSGVARQTLWKLALPRSNVSVPGLAAEVRTAQKEAAKSGPQPGPIGDMGTAQDAANPGPQPGPM